MTQDGLTNKKLNVKSVDEIPIQNVSFDTSGELVDDIVNYQGIDVSMLNALSTTSQRRDQLYDMIDSMCEDSRIAQALDIYVQNATEPNDQGNVIWCVSPDKDVQAHVSYLLDSINVNKYVYDWIYCLARYGDAYLEIFHNSELEPKKPVAEGEVLTEDTKLRLFKNSDKLSHYLELHPNPAEIFELTKHGKTYGYIKSPTTNTSQLNWDVFYNANDQSYKFKSKDVIVMGPDKYVHAALRSAKSRFPEKVQLFNSGADDEEYEFIVRKGRSILYNAFKSWRILQLLENSVQLNRVTKSSIIRVIGIKVGDMPKEEVQKHLVRYKQMIEQKSALNVGNSMGEYTNPGPMENFIITAIRDNDQGNIISTQLGGDNADVKSLADLEYFKNDMCGALGIPKQYLGDTGDGAGFDGGKALSLISSVFAKGVIALQSAIIQALQDALNLILIDSGYASYVNRFNLKMQQPTTQEVNDKQDAISKEIDKIRSILDLFNDIEDVPTRLKILNNLIAPSLSNYNLSPFIEGFIEKLENKEREEAAAKAKEEEAPEEDIDTDNYDLSDFGSGEEQESTTASEAEPAEEPAPLEKSTELPPMPQGMDFTDSSAF